MNTFKRRDRRLQVEPDLSLRGHSNVFAVGDLAYVESNGEAVPGLAPAALRMGKHVGRTLSREIGRGTSVESRTVFKYWDKGTLATIGRGKAVADVGRFKFGGVVAWLLWVFVHIAFLVGFRSRVMVLFEWAYAYITFRRGARLITGRRNSFQSHDVSVGKPNSPASDTVDLSARP